jgi:hypothetical protein
MARRLLLPAVVGAVLALPLPAAAAADPAPAAAEKVSEPTATAAARAIAGEAARERRRKHRARPRQRGGRVRAAWPRTRSDEAPDYPLTRWLARQVGPDATARDARAAATSPSAVEFAGGIQKGRLALIRSFDIPAGSSDHDRLDNLSWTYDNALAVIAFIDANAKSQAEQLLDQLAAVQLTDGSLEFAYDVADGKGSGDVRSGALAWVGIAATYYRRTYGSTRYDPLIAGVAKYLLGLRTSSGLVKGGPDVSWISTQHNLLTVAFLRDLVPSLRSKAAASSLNISATSLDSAQNAIGNAILARLIVQAGPYAYFIEGVGDTRIPIDVQSLGAMYLKLRGDGRAQQVGAYLSSSFYALARPALGRILFGYKPFNAAAAPDVVWSEGTIQADVALRRLGMSSTYADLAIANIAGLTNGYTVAPPQADQDATSDTSWGEYHTWPASAAASWLIMLTAGEGRQLFTR